MRVSDADSFIREVSEEVQRDRMFGLWKRYGPFVIGAIVAIVVATAGLQWIESRRAEAAREAGGRLLDALEADAPAARAEALLVDAEILDDGPARAARLAAAASLAEAGETAEAADLYAEIAETGGDAFAAFADLRAILLRARTDGASATIPRLSPIAESDGPFRLMAREARASALVAAGDAAAARADIEAVLADPEATEQMRLRLRELAATLPPAPEEAAE